MGALTDARCSHPSVCSGHIFPTRFLKTHVTATLRPYDHLGFLEQKKIAVAIGLSGF